jgi:hypothetical protein
LKKIFLILIIVIIFVSGCAKEKKLSFTVENLNDKQLSPGIYYEYKYSDEELKGSKEINSELILNNLIKKNTPLAEAWFKSYSASCCPPNTNRCMQAIVEPVFLIKLEEEIELDNFIKINEPKIGWCAYEVKHYTIQ